MARLKLKLCLPLFIHIFRWNLDLEVLNISITAQNFIDIPNFPDSRSYAKVLESQLVFCYHVLQCLFPVSQAVVFRRAVVFYVQAKEAWEWKKHLQQGWHSFLQKLLALIFSSSEITEKRQLGILRNFPLFLN